MGKNTAAMSRILLFLILALPGAAEINFNRDVRPIMSDTCFHCHGPDKSSRMAGLRLDLREEALKPSPSGVTPIVPGKPERSAIIERIFSPNAARLMPPKYAHKELTAPQKETIRQWVAEGARYEGHWAYQPVTRPAVPEVAGPVRNPIDAFVQDRLRREGLKPSPEADKRTLLRRVSFDLTGLPPSVQALAAFEKDTSPDAYEKAVDRLLESPRYAEKQALHWLDAVRYADTCGFHGDNPFPAWPYRDYVLRAFKDNKPFDVFTREQIAGDLIPDGGLEQKIASAYNRLNRTSAEGGIQPGEYLAKYAADRVRTTASIWLGSTVGCAECHDHKFDPFTAKDFYSFKAFFADIRETGLVPDRGPKAWGSQLELPDDATRGRIESLRSRLTEAREKLDAAVHVAWAIRGASWEKELQQRFDAGEFSWKFPMPLTATAKQAKLRIYGGEMIDSTKFTGASLVSERVRGDGLIVVSGPNPDNETYTVTLRPGAGKWTALGLEVVQDESLLGGRFARGSDRLVVTEVEAALDARRLPFSLATASFRGISPDLEAMQAIDGDPRTGWGLSNYGENRNLFLALRFAEPLATSSTDTLTVRIRHDSPWRKATLGRFKLALARGLAWPEPDDIRKRRKDPAMHGVPAGVLEALAMPAAERSEEQRKAVLDHFAWMQPELVAQLAAVASLEAELGSLEATVPRVVVTEATEPAITRILPRGNWMDTSGEAVAPAVPGFLGKLDRPGRATRLDLADWLVSAKNPLTARVWVNRQWRLLFGTGLSKVLDDIGSQGEWPTHLELLDWLAAEFQSPSAPSAHAWDMRHVIRTIVTSHTYRQSSQPVPALEERDPENRLLARQSRYRVDAEVVRDTALAVSGLLTESFGGPSVRPYQPEGYLGALNFPKRDYSPSHGSDLYRRSVYTVWQRTFLHPTLQAFDAPSREECTINRVNSNTPLQALVLLNDPIFVEAARVFAQNMIAKGGATAAGRIGYGFEQALHRKPTAAERGVLLRLYQSSLAKFTAAPAEARKLTATGDAPLPAGVSRVQLAATATVARALLNLHETITRY